MIYGNTTVSAGTFEISNNAAYGALASDVGQTTPDSFTALAGTTVQGGTYGTLCADNVVLDGATLDIAGRQAFATSGHYNTFVIDPSTLSMNGTNIIFNTYLGDDSSPSDLLILDGRTAGLTATGQAKITVNNTGGPGAQTTADGIKLVQVENNATTADDTFTLASRVAAGAYEYDLFKNGVGADAADGNWYLRSIKKQKSTDPEEPPVIRPEVPAYLANMRAVSDLFMMNLHDRLGEPQYAEYIRLPGADAKCPNCAENDCDNCICESCQKNGGDGKICADNGCKCCYKPANYLLSGWVRVQGRYSSYNEMDNKFDINQTRYLLNGGADIATWTRNGNDRWLLGIMGAYGHVGTNVKSKDVPVTPNSNISRKATADVDGTSAGAYLTWYASAPDQRGLYADIWALHGWFDNNVHGNAMPEEKYKSQNTQVSAELGYAFRVMHKENGRQLFIEPQGQFVYNFMNQDGHTETGGTVVNDADGSGWISRLGGRVYLNSEADKHHFQPFAELNWLHSSSKNKLAFDGVSISDDLNENTFELKLGASGMFAERWQLWGWVGAGTVNTSGYSVGGNVGIKYSFGGPKLCCDCDKEPHKQAEQPVKPVEQPVEQAKQPEPATVVPAKPVEPVKAVAPIPVTAETPRLAIIYFGFDKFDFTAQAAADIEKAAAIIKAHPEAKFQVQGNTDMHGSAAYNEKLSERRARAVYDRLVELGVPADSISYSYYGKSTLVNTDKSVSADAQNRRVEIVAPGFEQEKSSAWKHTEQTLQQWQDTMRKDKSAK